MYNEYNEEEIERFGKEGGGFLIKNGIIDTDDIEEIEKFKRGSEEEEIEKIDSEYKPRRFNIIKESERSRNTMFEDYELRDLIEEFNGEADEDIEKALKAIPGKLKEALGECYKILNEYKADLEEIPELLSAVKLLGRLATGKPGKEPYPYPYPGKVKKSEPMEWESMQDLLFGGHIPADDEIEKSSRANPFPSITRAIKIKKEAIDEIEEELEDE